MKNQNRFGALALVAWVVSSVLGCIGTAHADKIVGACSSDMQKFCGQVQTGDHEGLTQCLEQNQAKLSTGCQQERVEWKAHHDAMLDEAQKVFEACKPDMDKFCKDAQSQGPKPLMSCMKSHDQQISAGCKSERKNMWAMKSDKHKMSG
jgi:hypothetical protein